MNYHALCFVDMPFGQKSDLKSGVLVDFDQIYNEAIKPAIDSVDWNRSAGMKRAPVGSFIARCSHGCCYRSLLWPILRSPMQTCFMNSEYGTRRSHLRPCRFWPMLARCPLMSHWSVPSRSEERRVATARV